MTIVLVSSRRLGRAIVLCIALLLVGACDEDGSSAVDEEMDDVAEEEGEDENGGDDDYPPGPYGQEIGDVVENFSFEDAESKIRNIAGASEGADELLVIFGSAAWCTKCKDKIEAIKPALEEHGRDVAVLGVLFQDENMLPPSGTAAAKYNEANADNDVWEFVADRDGHLDELFGGTGMPRCLVIDVETKEILYKGSDLAAQDVIDEVTELL